MNWRQAFETEESPARQRVRDILSNTFPFEDGSDVGPAIKKILTLFPKNQRRALYETLDNLPYVHTEEAAEITTKFLLQCSEEQVVQILKILNAARYV